MSNDDVTPTLDDLERKPSFFVPPVNVVPPPAPQAEEVITIGSSSSSGANKIDLTNGSGVFAGERIDPGAFIAEYVGQYVRRDKSATYAYGVAVADDLVINALAAGNDMRFVNHSCRPNAELKKKHDPETGLERVGLYARNRIARDEEITFAYCPKPDLWFACKCGACVDSK